MVSAKIKRSFSGKMSKEVTWEDDTQDAIRARAMSDYIENSRRWLTQWEIDGGKTMAPADGQTYEMVITWDDGIVEPMVLPFPSPEATALPVDECCIVKAYSSIPLWGDPQSWEEPLTLVTEFGADGKQDVIDETEEWLGMQMMKLPPEIISVLSELHCPVVILLVFPDGSVHRTGAEPRMIRIGAQQTDTPAADTISSALNILMDEDE